MKVSRISAGVLTVLFLASTAGAIVINGAKGLPHTKSAWVTETGRMTMLSHIRFWGQVAPLKNPSEGFERAQTVWDVQGLASLNYGLGPHFGLTVTPIVYQDIQQGKPEEHPWDTFVGLQIGSFGSKISSLKYGIEFNARFPTGKKHNIVFEDYSAGRVEVGFTTMVSYAYDPLYPEDDLNVHFNLGYLHHNDVGKVLLGNLNPSDPLWDAAYVHHPSQEMLYAVGFTKPTKDFNYGLEWYGNIWLQQPPPAAAARENYLYMNAVVTYKATRWFDFSLSGEYRLTADYDQTTGPRTTAPYQIPNFNTWRINAGAKFVLLPTSVYRTNERDILMQKAETRRELFEQIITEKRETESAEEELDRIKEERRNAERELERLRKLLEGQPEQKPPLEEVK
jgi:hypothetical protein